MKELRLASTIHFLTRVRSACSGASAGFYIAIWLVDVGLLSDHKVVHCAFDQGFSTGYDPLHSQQYQSSMCLQSSALSSFGLRGLTSHR